MSTITMGKTSMIRARVEPELKEQSESVLRELGLTTSDLISMTLRQLVMRRAVPFDVKIPNQETIDALNENVSKAKRYSDPRAMLSDILAESD